MTIKTLCVTNRKGKEYTPEDLYRIGQNVAANWGAVCLDYEIDYENEEVTFICNEFGEIFATTLEFAKLEEYDF